MAFANFSPGSYTVTYNNNDLGLVQRPSLLRRTANGQPITVDLYGDAVVDGIYRGGRVFVMCHFAEWSANLRSALWPFSATFGADGLAGRLWSDMASTLVLTPVANSPAAVLGNNTFTAAKTIVAAQNNVDFVLGNVERNIPVMFECLLYDASGTKVHFVLS